MYIGLQHLHSYWAYLTVLLIVLAIASSFMGWLGKNNFTPTNRKIALFALIATHIQALGGLIVYFVSPIVQAALADFGGAMKNADLRLFSLEHPLMMVIGITLITMGFSKAKKAEAGVAQHKLIAIFYTIGFLIILSRIPYSVWF